MAQRGFPWLLGPAFRVCRRCTLQQPLNGVHFSLTRNFSRSQKRRSDVQFAAAPEIDFTKLDDVPTRILPASPSYFTASPVFNDYLLLLQTLLVRYKDIPTISAEDAPRNIWMKLSQYRSSTGERIPAAKYAKVLELLNRLTRIHPKLQPVQIQTIIKQFQRPGVSRLQQNRASYFDEHGRAFGVGRRKESSARVYLVEGTGEVIVNGKNIVQVFPRLHHRESALWPLKISERTDKYNVFALVKGGGVTGQAESITLGITRALLIHEPALKPVLRRAGCVTSDARRVERKKPGRRKARKRPAWVKR